MRIIMNTNKLLSVALLLSLMSGPVCATSPAEPEFCNLVGECYDPFDPEKESR